MFGCQQVLIKSDKGTQAVLEYLCSESAKLSNCGIYYSRQLYFTHWQNSEPCSVAQGFGNRESESTLQSVLFGYSPANPNGGSRVF